MSHPNIKKTKDDIPYIEIAGIKYVALQPDKNLRAILPVYNLTGDKPGIRVDSFDYEDIIVGIQKFKKDLFDFIFVKELKRDK